MIKHVDIQSHHIIVAIQPLPVVVAERIFSTTVTLRNEIHNQLPQSPLSSVHNPAFALRTVIFYAQLCSEVSTPRRHTTQMNAESLKNTLPSQFSNPACITGCITLALPWVSGFLRAAILAWAEGHTPQYPPSLSPQYLGQQKRPGF